MSTVSKLITDIRDTLGDQEATRWSDARLIRGINNAMKDINSRARILRSKLSFDILAGVHTYKLPDEVQLITRATFDGKPLDFNDHEQMDVMKETWEEQTSDTVTHIVYDRLNRGQLRLYPTPEIDLSASPLGVVTDIEGASFNSLYGVVTDLGLTNGSSIVIYYIMKPTLVTELTDTVVLDSTWDTAIVHHAAGHILRDDRDTQNRAFGNEELTLYERELTVARVDGSKDFTKRQKYTAEYRRI